MGRLGVIEKNGIGECRHCGGSGNCGR
jgi:hypothetical protein